MKTKILSVILFLNMTAMTAQPTFAFAPAQKNKTKTVSNAVARRNKPKTNPALNARLSTDIQFDGQLVGGRIQSPFESLAVVENEKAIDDLIGVRTNFSDRSQKSKGMR